MAWRQKGYQASQQQLSLRLGENQILRDYGKGAIMFNWLKNRRYQDDVSIDVAAMILALFGQDKGIRPVKCFAFASGDGPADDQGYSYYCFKKDLIHEEEDNED